MLLSLMIRLMLNSVVIILAFLIILLIKELFKNHLTWKAKYRIWYYLLLVLIFPFLPTSIIHAGLSLLSLSGGSVSSVKAMTPTFSNDAGISSFIQDFSISVSRSRIFHLPAFLPYIWGLGISIVSILNLISDIKIRRIRQASLPLQNRKIRTGHFRKPEYLQTVKQSLRRENLSSLRLCLFHLLYRYIGIKNQFIFSNNISAPAPVLNVFHHTNKKQWCPGIRICSKY